jgi:YidC/Oxa1 family membrane protein insertase
MFHDFIYQPLYNILIALYNFIPGSDFGISIVVFTVILRAILMPLYKKQVESQKKLQELQPRIKEIQQKHKSDKEKQTKELMEFYKTNKTNPFSGCVPMIVQLVFLIAIYRVLINISNAGFAVRAEELYSFISNPGTIKHIFIGIIDLTKPNIGLAILAAGAQFIQTKMLMSKKPQPAKSEGNQADFAQIMNKQMLYLGPLLTLFIGVKFAAGLALYWLSSTLFMIAQQWQLAKDEKNKP